MILPAYAGLTLRTFIKCIKAFVNNLRVIVFDLQSLKLFTHTSKQKVVARSLSPTFSLESLFGSQLRCYLKALFLPYRCPI
ncbi:MAG: hypothetical protein WCZ90_19030 [Melioribacteraceae bacterium]